MKGKSFSASGGERTEHKRKIQCALGMMMGNNYPRFRQNRNKQIVNAKYNPPW